MPIWPRTVYFLLGHTAYGYHYIPVLIVILVILLLVVIVILIVLLLVVIVILIVLLLVVIAVSVMLRNNINS